MELSDYLTPRDIRNLLEGLYQQNYSLILGAGASASSTNIRGKKIPVSSNLVTDILETYSIKHAPDRIPDLNRTFQKAVKSKNTEYPKFRDYLNDTFTCDSHSDFYDKILNFKWKYIWNLNIDDCVEKSYRGIKDELKWSIKSITFTDGYIPDSPNQTLHVHLHGAVGKIDDNADNVIFTLQQYLRFIESKNTWLTRFNDIYPEQPVIILGATVHGEFDIQDALLDKPKYSIEKPSIIVLRTLDDFDIETYRDLGLIAIEASTEEFIEALTVEFNRYLDSMTNIQRGLYYDPSILEKRINYNWKYLFKTDPFTDDLDLYRGHEPKWDDSLNLRFAKRDERDKIYNSTKDLTQKGFSLISGPTFSGKTSLCFSIAYQLVSQGNKVYFFDYNNGKFNKDDVRELIDNSEKLYLIFDNSIDILDEIVNVYIETEKSKKVYFLVTCRDHRVDTARSILAGAEKVLYRNISGKLSAQEIKSLYEKLDEFDSLGYHQGETHKEVEKYFTKHENNMFSAMAGLGIDNGRFEDRIKDYTKNIRVSDYKNLLISIAIPNTFSLHLPLEIVSSVSGLTADKVQSLSNGELSKVITIQDSSIRCHHKYMSEVILNEFPKNSILKQSKKMLKEFSRYITPRTRNEKNIYYSISRSIMRFEHILRLANEDTTKAVGFYKDIKEYYKDNSRFWDQFALAHAANLDFHSAISCAYKSLKSENIEHPFALNTIATVHFKYIIHELASGRSPFNSSMYNLACDFLEKAHKQSDRLSEYPVMTFIKYTKDILSPKYNLSDSEINMIKSRFIFWYSQKIIFSKTFDTKSLIYRRVESSLDDMNLFFEKR